MNRFEQAVDYHHKGFNCCQSVLATYSDLTGLSEQASFDMGGGFGAGAQTGELCGAITGAILTLGLLTPVDAEDPVGSKRRTGKLAKEFQKRFQEKFGDLRCHPPAQAGDPGRGPHPRRPGPGPHQPLRCPHRQRGGNRRRNAGGKLRTASLGFLAF